MSLKRIAFLGLGAMGRPMAGRLLDAGFDLKVWNRTSERTQELEARGATVAATPADAARGADALLSILRDAHCTEAVLSGSDGAMEALAEGALVCDMSTVTPVASRSIAETCHGRGLRFVDAPVYGSVGPATKGTLVILAGGEPADIETLAPVFDCLGHKTFHAGPAGSGSALKIAINTVGGHVLTGIACGLHMAQASGLDGALFLDALDMGGFTSPLVESKGRRKMLSNDFTPDFTVELTLKDMRLVADTACQLGARLPSVDALVDTYDRAVKQGLGSLDLSAVIRAFGPSDAS